MKKVILLFLAMFLILISFSAAAKDNDPKIYHSEYLILNTDISTQAMLEQAGPSPNIKEISAEIGFFPIPAENQRILSSNYAPQPKNIDNEKGIMYFTVENPGQVTDIRLKNSVRVENKQKKIRQKISFPIQNIPSDLQSYTAPAEIIDINSDIIKMASSLAQGEDDALVVVDKIAAWINANINYNLNSAAAQATEKSSWVLKNREGVCDEITSLFISMLRSLGIPARFVAGMAYSNSPQIPTEWGPHGWAEVFFPGYGWVPYDPTYGEYGFVDASHVISRYSNDADKIKIKFQWTGRDINVKLGDLKTDVKVAEYGPQMSPKISIDLSFLKDSVDFSSYNLAIAKIKNLVDYYQPVDIYISNTSKIILEESYKKHFILAPYEEKNLFWILKIEGGLQQDMIYTFPISVYTAGNGQGLKEFKAIKDGINLKKERIQNTIASLSKGGEKILSAELGMECKTEKNIFQQDETIPVSCSLKNNGNVMLEKIEVCIEGSKECAKTDIGINREEKIVLNILGKNLNTGKNKMVASASKDNIFSSSAVEIEMLDKPLLEAADISFQREIKYNDEVLLHFNLHKGSSSNPQNVIMNIIMNSGSSEKMQEYKVGTVEQDTAFDIPVYGRDMKKGTNDFVIILQFSDSAGNSYKTEKQFTTSLVDVTLWQSIKIFFKSIF